MLAGGGICYQKCFFGSEETVQLFELTNEFFIDFLTTSGVENHQSTILALCPFQGIFRHFDEVCFRGVWSVNGYIDLFRQRGLSL